MFKIFLDKADQRKIEFFRYLENRPLLMEMKEKIIDDLDISEFLLNKTVEELNADFEEYGLTDEFQLVLNNANVELIETGLGTSHMFEILFVENSLAFLMIKEILFEEFESVNEYAVKNYISYPPVYKKLKELRSFFEEFDLSINKKFVFEGNEKNIRSFFTFLLPQVFRQNFDVYPKSVWKKTQAFIRRLEKRRDTPIPAYAKLKLSHFLCISFLRMNKGHFMEKDSFILNRTYLVNNKQYKWISNWLSLHQKNISERSIESETDEIFAFLVSEEIFEVTDYLTHVEKKNFKKLSRLFINAVEEKFPFASEYIKKSQQRIDLLHFQVLYFKMENIEASKNMDISYFVDNFPEYVWFCRNFLEENKSKKQLWELKEYLFCQYLLILVDSLSLDQLLSPIYLYIDFSFGKTYNNMIRKNIEKLSELNIVYQAYIDEQTDLILSDIHFKEYETISQIVWLAPPRAVDWANFTTQLMVIRKENSKYTQKNS